MRRRAAGLFSAALVSSVIISGCGNNSNTESAAEGSSSGLAEEQVLNLVATAEIPTMDSSKSSDAVAHLVMNNVYEGLYRLDGNDELVPGMAKEHDVSDDGLTYTFHLREDAKWSNGDPVTAHDFVYAWRRTLEPTTASEYAYFLFDVKNAEAINKGELDPEQLGVTAEDDYTLVVELEKVVPYFIEMTVFSKFLPLNQEYVESQGNKYALEADAAIYNGPFVLAEWKHEQGWQYQKNDQYWDSDNVILEEINVNVVKDNATAVGLYETGKADYVDRLSADFVDKYRSDENFGTELEPSAFFLYLNQDVEELANENLRKAIAMSFNKQGMADVVLNNGSVVSDGLVPKDFAADSDGVDFRTASGDVLSYDVEQAQAYWEKAKEELGMDNLTLEYLTDDTDGAKKAAEYLQAEIEQNLEGIKIEIKQQPFKQRLELQNSGDFQISIGGWSPDYPDPMNFLELFVSEGSFNRSKYSSTEYDSLIEQAKGELLQDLDARWDAMLEAEKILLEEAGIAPIYQRGNAYLQQPYVKNIYSHQFGGDYTYKWAYIDSH